MLRSCAEAPTHCVMPCRGRHGCAGATAGAGKNCGARLLKSGGGCALPWQRPMQLGSTCSKTRTKLLLRGRVSVLGTESSGTPKRDQLMAVISLSTQPWDQAKAMHIVSSLFSMP